MSTHECPAPGCQARVPSSMFACRPHWFALLAAMDRATAWLREHA